MAPANPARITFVAYGGGHVNMMLPVVERLRTMPQVHVDVIGLTTARRTLEAAGIPCLGFQDITTPEDEHALSIGEGLAKDLPHDVVPKAESIAYLGLSYVELEASVGSQAAAAEYESRGRQSFLPVRVMQRFFTKLRSDLVIATSSPRAERAAILAAGEMGIPSICLCDFLASELQWVGQAGYATRLCVWSERMKQQLLECGRREEEIVLTGNPALEVAFRPDLPAKAAQIRRDRGWGNDKVILWIAQLEPSHNPFTGETGDEQFPQKIEAELCQIVARRQDWRLVMRLHPNDTRGYGPLGERVESSAKTEDLMPLLQSVDAVVLCTSTVALFASLLDKPLVAVKGSVFSRQTDYEQMGMALGVDRLPGLEGALEEALSGRWVASSKVEPAPDATGAVIREMEQLLGRPLAGTGAANLAIAR